MDATSVLVGIAISMTGQLLTWMVAKWGATRFEGATDEDGDTLAEIGPLILWPLLLGYLLAMALWLLVRDDSGD